MKRPPMLGLALGTSRASLAMASLGPDRVELQTEITWRSEDEAGGRLREALAQVPADIDMAVSIPDPHVRTRLVELPLMKRSDVETAVASRLRKYLPYRADDWHLFSSEARVATLDPSKRAHLATLVSNPHIQGILKLLEPFADRWPRRQLETPARALQRWLLWERPALRTGVHVAAHFEKERCIVWATSEGSLVLSREIAPLAVDAANDADPAALTATAKQIHAVVAWLRFRTLSCEIAPSSILVTGIEAPRAALAAAIQDEVGVPVTALDAPRLHAPGAEIALGLSLTAIEEGR